MREAACDPSDAPIAKMTANAAIPVLTNPMVGSPLLKKPLRLPTRRRQQARPCERRAKCNGLRWLGGFRDSRAAHGQSLPLPAIFAVFLNAPLTIPARRSADEPGRRNANPGNQRKACRA